MALTPKGRLDMKKGESVQEFRERLITHIVEVEKQPLAEALKYAMDQTGLPEEIALAKREGKYKPRRR